MEPNSTFPMTPLQHPKPEACELSTRLAESLFLRGGMLLKAVLCFVCLPAAWYIFRKKGLRWLGNSSTKALFIFHLIWAVEVPVTFGIAYAFDAIRLSLPQNGPCGYTITAYTGFVFRGPPGYGVAAQTISVLVFAIERAISTIFPRYFDKRGSWLGIFLITSFTTINTIWWTSRTIFMADWTDIFVLCTVWTRTTLDLNRMTVLIYFVIECITLTIFVGTWMFNTMRIKHLTVTNADISEKYQIGENRRVIGALAPCFFLHWLFSSIQYGCIILQKNIPEIHFWGSASAQILIEIFAFQPYLYLISMAFILNCFLNRQKRLVVDSHVVMDSYFDQINVYFEEHFDRRVASQELQRPQSANWSRLWNHIAIVCHSRRTHNAQ